MTTLRPIYWSEDPLGALVLPQGHVETLEALYRTYLNDWKDVTIQHEGKGLKVLLDSSVPGVGKRSTARAFAESCRRPCLRLIGAELGGSARKVERLLVEILELSQRWNCILSIEDADFFLKARSKNELVRSGCVRVFLEALELHTGLVFLTRNGFGTFDQALRSRIHMSLYYPQPNQKSALKIWQVFLDRASKENQIDIDREAIHRYAENHINVRVNSNKAPWTGKQIKDAFRIAIAIAKSDAKAIHQERPRLMVTHFEEFVQLSEGQNQ